MSASTLLTPGPDGDHRQSLLDWPGQNNSNTTAAVGSESEATAAASSSSSSVAPASSGSVSESAAAPSLTVSTQDSATTSAVPCPSPPAPRIVRRNGTGPQTPRGGGGSHNSDPASESSRTQAASSLSEVEHDEFLAQHEVVYGRTLTCQAPRALLWKALIRKIRHPELYTHAAGVKILCEGIDFVFREIRVSPLGACGGGGAGGAAGSEPVMHFVREKVTWDEANENVRFTLYEDPHKEGYIENQISLDASGAVCLTVSCHWTFTPRPELTVQCLELWTSKLRAALDAGCAKTVRVVEEEAKALLQERRRRHSLSQVAEQADTQRFMQQLALKEKSASAAAAVSPAPATAPSASPVPTSPTSRTKHIAVAAKPADN